jgi:uncharacterized protein YkwD
MIMKQVVYSIICSVLGFGMFFILNPSSAARDLPSKPRTTAITGRSDGKKHNIDVGRLEKKIHDLINQERKKKGLASLSWNKSLNSIARSYSRDMIERKFFSHNDPDGRSFIDRYHAGGFVCKLRNGNETCLGAENIAQDNLYSSVVYRNGVPSYSWNSEDEIAASVVKRWMQSRGHRGNILTAYFKRQGIGVAVSDDGKVYVTENFC